MLGNGLSSGEYDTWDRAWTDQESTCESCLRKWWCLLWYQLLLYFLILLKQCLWVFGDFLSLVDRGKKKLKPGLQTSLSSMLIPPKNVQLQHCSHTCEHLWVTVKVNEEGKLFQLAWLFTMFEVRDSRKYTSILVDGQSDTGNMFKTLEGTVLEDW